MAENLKVGDGAGESTPVSEKPIDSDATALIKSLEAKVTSLSSELRGLQGRQDKVDTKVNQSEQTILEKVKDLMKNGMTIDEAQREIEWQTVRDTVLNKSAPAPTLAQGDNSAKSNAGDEAKALVKELQLDLNDQKVAEAYGKNDIVGLAKLAVSRQSPAPTAADAPPPSGTSARPPDEEDLIAKLRQLQKNPTKNMKAMLEIEKQLGWS